MFGKFKLKNSNFAVQFRLKVVVNSQKHLLGSHVTSVVKYLRELMGICWIWNSQNRNYQLISCDIEVVAVRKRKLLQNNNTIRSILCSVCWFVFVVSGYRASPYGFHASGRIFLKCGFPKLIIISSFEIFDNQYLPVAFWYQNATVFRGLPRRPTSFFPSS